MSDVSTVSNQGSARLNHSWDDEAVLALCRERIAAGSKSFAGASRLFDDRTRDYAMMLYAWCRHCDDVIDDQTLGFATDTVATPGSKVPVLEKLRADTLAAMRGTSHDPVFHALGRVVTECQIPERHPIELIDGFAMDVEGRSYETIEDTLAYGYHVAGVVGVMMAMVMGVRNRDTLNRAADLGIAFQLTNIARDVLADASAGRVYLPGQWLDEAGIPRHCVRDPRYRAAVHGVVVRLLDTADDYYDSARAGIIQLPYRCAWAITTAHHIYRDIGNIVRRRGPAAWDRRAVVSRPRKLAGAGRALVRATLVKTFLSNAGIPDRDGLWTKPGLGA